MIARGSIIPSLAIVLLMVVPEVLRAQTIDGVVRDHETGLTLAGAEVVAFIDGREIGIVATDSAGHFTVRTWRAATVALRVAHAGYLPADVAITVALGERAATTVFLSGDCLASSRSRLHFIMWLRPRMASSAGRSGQAITTARWKR